MRFSVTHSIIIVGALVAGSHRADSADDATFRTNLPHCPASLTLSAPSVFRDASSDPEILETMAANSARKGKYVLALSAPNSEIKLLVAELGSTAAAQGNVSQADFDRLSGTLVNLDPAILERGRMYAQKLAAGSKVDAEVLGQSVYGVQQTTTSATLLGITTIQAGGDIGTYFVSGKFALAQKCIAFVELFVPITAMSRQAFEDLSMQVTVR